MYIANMCKPLSVEHSPGRRRVTFMAYTARERNAMFGGMGTLGLNFDSDHMVEGSMSENEYALDSGNETDESVYDIHDQDLNEDEKLSVGFESKTNENSPFMTSVGTPDRAQLRRASLEAKALFNNRPGSR